MRKGDSKGYGTFDEERAKAYAAFAAEVFAPIYPVIALQIEKQCDVREGLCIDVGSGPALLAIALARITSLTLWAVDISKPILEIARENIVREGLAERVRPLAGDVHNMPFLDGTAELVVSRGSARFWRNRPAALREIRRVLKPGGRGFVGGGMGDPRLIAEIRRRMAKRDPEWRKRSPRKSGKQDESRWRGIMKQAGFSRYTIINDDTGFWVYFEKT